MFRHIDVWILDTEGSEFSIMQGMDFEEISVSTMVIECDQHDNSKNAKKTDFLKEKGFICEQVLRNCMCRHKDFQPSRAPSDSMTNIIVDGGRKRPPTKPISLV